MAGIDKIYMTKEQGKLYWMWMLDHETSCSEQTGKLPSDSFYETENGYVTNNTESVDWYLWNNCDLPFVQDRLKEQYPEEPNNDYQRMINYMLKITDMDAEKVIDIVNFCSDFEFEIRSKMHDIIYN